MSHEPALAALAWLQESGLARLLDASRYTSMAVQAVHVLGFIFLLGVVVVFNLRLQRAVLRSLPVATFTRVMDKPYRAALVATLIAGILLFLPRAVAYGANNALLMKLGLLGAVMILQWGLQRKARALTTVEASAGLRAVALLALLLWFAVGAAGRAIGFV